jgi:polyribonucleotide nucleotidyltransferase
VGKLGIYEHTVEIDGKTITFEAGKIALQAGGAVITTIGDTKVLTTTTAGPPKDFLPFFPLTIEVEERMYATGRIPGSFFKREGRPSENAILTARLTDRPLRPTFIDGLRNEVQVVNTILQTTQFDPYDVIAMNGSSLATQLSGLPFDGPIGAVRYAMMRDGSWVAFPSFEELEEEAVFNMVVAGRVEDDGEVAILMIEAEATRDAYLKVEMGAVKPTEEAVGQAIEDVKPILAQLVEAQVAFTEQVGRRDAGEFPVFLDYTDDVFAALESLAKTRVTEIYRDAGTGKEAKNDALFSVRDESVATLVEQGVGDLGADEITKQAKNAFRSLEKKVVRQMIADDGVRIDGRGVADIRELSAEVAVLPKTHGTGLFQRGETQVLSVLALGSTRENQRLDTLDPVEEKYYMHHYNMPPYSTGETGRVGSPKRREIGHGLLAERALVPVLPSMEEWPYTMRIVSDIMSSNGSTSMGSVCASTLALMDGGVPIHAPVSGIAMGLIYENGTYTTLTDIQGVEDFYGDMDFKVAGPRDFITALQLDTKLSGIPSDVLRDALLQAKDARLQILDVMLDAIAEPRAEVAEGAPRVEVVHIPQDKIGEVIGPRGKIIKEITEETGAEIDIEEVGGRGVVRIYANSREVAGAAVDRVNAIANPTIPEVGERYNATVVKTVDFGAFVSLTPGIDGLLHISALSKMVGRRLEHAEEAVDVGDKVWVEIKDVLDGGRKFKLEYVGDPSAPSSSDDAAPEPAPAPAASDEDGGERGGRERSRDRGRRDRGGDDASGGGERTRTRTRSRSRERD